MRTLITAAALAAAMSPAMAQSVPCDTPRIEATLIRIANNKGVRVDSVNNMYWIGTTYDGSLCGAVAWTSAGRLEVTYTVRPMNFGNFWVQITSYRRV
jgi:hypothetical protein